MKKIEYALLISLICVVLVAGCSGNQEVVTSAKADSGMSEENGQERVIAVDKVEIIHFHGTRQCYSCITLGDYAEATIEAYFSDEVESGVVVFHHLNGELPENYEMVMKYGASGSSLFIGTYDGEEFSSEENTNVWYKIRNKQDFMDYLKDVIEQKLAGV